MTIQLEDLAGPAVRGRRPWARRLSVGVRLGVCLVVARGRPRVLGGRGVWTRRRGLASGLLAAVMMLVVASPVQASPVASHPLTSDIQSIGAGGGSAVWWQSCKFIDEIGRASCRERV